MATRDIYQQTRDARTADRMIGGGTANPNATPGAGRGSRNGSPWGMQAPVGQRIAAGPQTPGLDSNPRRSTADAVAESNRSGAFGTGAVQHQNLKDRQSLFHEMAMFGDSRPASTFKGRAATLGVTPGGWQNAVNRLSGGGNTSAAPATQLATTATKPEIPPNAPLSNQTAAPSWDNRVIAGPPKPNPYSVPPTTGSMTPQQARESTQAAINIGKPAPMAAPAVAPPAIAAAPIPEIPPSLYPTPQPSLSQTPPADPQPSKAKPKKKAPKGILESLMSDASAVKNATANVAGNIAYAAPWAIQSAMPGQTGQAIRKADVAGKFRKAGNWLARNM